MSGLLLRWSQLFVRSAAVVNLIDLSLEVAFPQYARLVANGPFGSIVILWLPFSALLLPLLVGLEVWWIKKRQLEARSVRIEAVLAVSWFLAFWIRMLYVITHNVLF